MLEDKQKKRMLKMFKKTLEDLTKEKIDFPAQKYKDFVKNLKMTVKFEVLSLDWKDKAGTVWYQIKNGVYKISEEPISGVEIEIRAPMINVFNFARRDMSTLKALFGGLKINGKRHFFLLLKLNTIFRIIPEKEYKKHGLPYYNI